MADIYPEYNRLVKEYNNILLVFKEEIGFDKFTDEEKKVFWEEVAKNNPPGEITVDGLNKYIEKKLSPEKLATLKSKLNELSVQKPEKKKQRPEKNKDEDDTTIRTSSLVTDSFIAEQVYNGIKCLFCVYSPANSEIQYLDKITYNGSEFAPLVGEEIQKKAILLPSVAEDYGTEEELDQEIIAFILRWLDVPSDFLQFSLWNIKRSWVYDKFNTLNYLRFMGDTGQGKTRALDTIGSIHYKPIMTSGATTAAPVFRIIEKWRGTMVFDECDLKITDETADIIKIINMGYEKGKNVMRCDQNDATKIMFFDPFCPKVIATRKPFEDKAVESRCFTNVMLGTHRKDIPFNLNDSFFTESQTLRNKLLMWRFKNYFIIDPTYRPNMDFSHLEPRVQQIFTSFMALFGRDEVKMTRFRTFIEEYQEELIDERQNSWEGQIVIAIHDLIERGQTEISATDIILEAGLTNDRGIQLKPRALTNVIRELGFGKSKIIKVENKTKRVIPLDQELLNHLFERYGVTKVTVVRGSSSISSHPPFSKYVGKNEVVESGEGGLTPEHSNSVTTVTNHPNLHRKNTLNDGSLVTETIVTTVTEVDVEEVVDDNVITTEKVIKNELLPQEKRGFLKDEIIKKLKEKGPIRESALWAEFSYNTDFDTFADTIDSLKEKGEIVETPVGVLRIFD